jgi:hypothetical protein
MRITWSAVLVKRKKRFEILMLPLLALREAPVQHCALPAEVPDLVPESVHAEHAESSSSSEGEADTGALYGDDEDDTAVSSRQSRKPRKSAARPLKSPRLSTSSKGPEFNTDEFWKMYEGVLMAHFVTVYDPDTTRMAVTTKVRSTGKRGPSYYQSKDKNGQLRWNEVRSWLIEKGGLLRVERFGTAILDFVGVKAFLVDKWHDFR